MEPMVVCALGIVLYYSYLTVREILNDLKREGFLFKVRAGAKCIGIARTGIVVNSRRLGRIGGLKNVPAKWQDVFVAAAHSSASN